jgi:electron transport complex protein RnfG
MKTVFNTAVFVVALAAPNLAAAQQQYWTPDALVHDMFPTSDGFETVPFTLDDATKAAAEAELGYRLAAGTFTVEVVTTGEHVDGIVWFDEQQGQHEPIDFAVELDPAGVVIRQEVLVYREKYGSEVTSPRFRAQFVGKTAADPLVAGKDVRIVSGATYSSRAMAVGVKRATVLGRMFLDARP